MDGPIREGHFKDAAGEWWLVERRHYPKKRWVIRQCKMVNCRPELVGNDTPVLTPARWAELRDWL